MPGRRHAPTRVAVIGGGPAGCAAVHALATSGVVADVTVLERGEAGKDKACGDALVPSAVALYRRLGVDGARLCSLGGRRFERFDWRSGDALLREATCPGEGWIVPRSALDQAARDVVAAYAAFRYETEAVAIAAEPDGRLALTSRTRSCRSDRVETFDAVVLAAGTNNRLARGWGVDGAPVVGASISAYAEVGPLDTPYFDMRREYRPGYAWVFPVSPTTANVGVCTLGPAHGQPLRRLAEEYLLERAGPQPVRWRGGGGPLWSGRGRVWHHDAGIVSCGDSAGLIDPLNGEGITAALESGENAGRAVAAYLGDGRRALHLAAYSRWVATHFGEAYRASPANQIWSLLCGVRSPVATG